MLNRGYRIALATFGLLLASGAPAFADSDLFYKEIILSGGTYNGDVDVMRSHPQSSVGLDWLHKYADAGGDWATVGVQFRFIVNAETNRLEPDLMDAYLNLRGYQGRANWRLGKFEIPYGLEPVLDTHGTLLQSNMHHNLGSMWSWGTELNGQLDDVDYRVALLTGDFSENYPHHEQGSWLIAGRIGSPRAGADSAWGLSVAAGRTTPSMHGEHVASGPHDTEADMHDRETAVDIVRLGADYLIERGEDIWLMEGSVGLDDGDPMGSVWVRWERTPYADDRWTYALQAEGVWHPPDMEDDFLELSTQVSYRLSSETTVRFLAGHAFDTITGDPEDRLLLQFYYFGL